MTKHFPGGGPQKDGEDPHFSYGREQVYPGGRFDYHLEPFRAALEAGTSQMMPYYGMPVGTEHEEVGFSFNQAIITDLLREQLGFDGIVCTDWGLVNDTTFAGEPMLARAWGVEHLTPLERVMKASTPASTSSAGRARRSSSSTSSEAGRVTEARIDESVRRLLREKFVLGLFDDPFLDVDRAAATVGRADFVAAGAAAQRAAIVLLTAASPARRLCRSRRAADLRRGLGSDVRGPPRRRRRRPGRRRRRRAAAGRTVGRATRHGRPLPRRVAGVPARGTRPHPADLRHGADDRRPLPGAAGGRAQIAGAAAALLVNFGRARTRWSTCCSVEAQARGRLPFDLPPRWRPSSTAPATRRSAPRTHSSDFGDGIL